MSWTKVQGYVVILLSLLCISSTTAATLFPFGDSAGDLELTNIGDDEYFTVIFSKLNFPFDGVSRNYITIDDNGNINFEGASSYPVLDMDVIGALWQDLAPGTSSRVYFRETMENSLLFNVSLVVRQIHGVPDFCPIWAFVATWVNYGYYKSPAADLNFQTVLTSDGTISYAVFLYDQVTDEPGINIGVFATTGNYDYICQDVINGTDLVNRRQSVCQSQPGILSFRTDMIQSIDCSGNHPADIVFLLDSSGSVGELNFQKLKEFVAQFAQSVEIGNGPNEVQIGAVTWSSSVYNQFNLNTFSTKTALLNAIDGISYNSGSTKTHLALDYVRVNSFQPSVGDRANVPNILVVITGDESDSSSQTATAAQALHAIPGLTIFAIGVRGGVTGELGIIASDLRKVLVANDFSTLQVLQTMIQRQICAANSGIDLCRELISDSGCSSDSDCTMENTAHCPRCNTGSATCVECLSDGDCSTAEKQFCIESIGLCVGCKTDENCKKGNIPYCACGLCRECTSHRHCTNDPKRVCSVDFQCTECLDDTHCQDITKPVCDSEQCVCLSDKDCDSSRICDPATRQCVCRGDRTPCNGAGMSCDTSGKCICSDGKILSAGRCITNVCPLGTNTFTLRGCPRPGRLGGNCVLGRCFGKNIACNQQSNRCVCSERKQTKMICHDRH